MDGKKSQIERELLASSLEARAQLAKDLEHQRKERRRQSIALNNEIMSRAIERERELISQQKQYENNLLESRKEDFKGMRNFITVYRDDFFFVGDTFWLVLVYEFCENMLKLKC
jgi:serine phosphatase RsbU (regulator of sigma subunit)